MTVLVIADLHLSDNPRDEYRHYAMGTIRQIMRDHEVKLLLILGDLTDQKDRHGAWLVNNVVEQLDKFADICPVIVLRGNHDCVVQDNPFFEFVAKVPDIRWVNKPEVIHLEMGKSLFLPHTHDWEKDWNKPVLAERDVEWVFTHNLFEGALSESGQQLHGIPTNLFDASLKVISGDVHAPQKGGPVTYVGAPYTINYGDDYEPRVLLIEKGKLKSIPVPGPQKRLIEIGTKEHIRDSYFNKGDMVKIKVNLLPSEYARWAEIRQRWKEWAEGVGLIINSVTPVIDKPGSKALKRSAPSRLSDEELLRRYVKARGIDERTAKIGLEILQEG